MTRVLPSCLLALSVGAVFAPMASAQGYKTPPAEIVAAVDAPLPPAISISPTRDKVLILTREALPPVAELAKPMERLAGLRIDPRTNDDHGPRAITGLSLIAAIPARGEAASAPIPIDLPAGADIDDVTWSADGKLVAFTMTQSDGLGLWVLDVASAKARPLIASGVNGVFDAFDWMPDNRRLVVNLVPANRGAAPQRGLTPTGPAVQETAGQTAPVRTFQDLLNDPHDEAMFDWLATSQIALVDAKTGKATPIGAPGVYRDIEPAPGGEYLLSARLQRPYSYIVPFNAFATRTEVWDLTGKAVAVIADAPLAEAVPIGGVPTGRRGIAWHDNHPARLLWVEAQDEGNPKKKVTHRDAVFALAAPFAAPRQIGLLEDRFSGLLAIGDGGEAIVSEYDRDTRELTQWQIALDQPAAPRQLFKRNIQDGYNDPGAPLRSFNRYGRATAHVDQGALLLAGDGASPEGDRPFLRRFDLATLTTTELWRNAGDHLERVIALAAADGAAVFTMREDKANPANLHLRRADGAIALTTSADPHPALTAAKKELVRYTRADGVELSATLYLPAGHQPGQQLPVFIWAYPFEYNDAATAGQISGSPHEFTRITGPSPLFLLTQGWAVMMDATMPVVGADPETVNDTYIEQIVASAKAAIDKTVAMGFGDGKRVAVGGHSYGAFMTANLLAHSDLFMAGVARSGAYNRTLTPFGFQSERRTYWEAPEIYNRLSPFMNANKINEPILMTHGEADNNPGTFPLQSERLYGAIKGHGGTARLVLLPHESHGYRGRESVLHTIAETLEWLDRHVKQAQIASAAAPSTKSP